MLKPRYVNESRWNYGIASEYYDKYCFNYRHDLECKPSFTFDDIEYFTVDNREDGLTKLVFYNKNKECLFSDLY